MFRPYRTSEQIKSEVAQLERGLKKLGPTFIAELCGMCEARGQYQQTYCDGPNGSFRMMGDCDYCQGYGLRIGIKPAPSSVYEQVMNAGSLEVV